MRERQRENNLYDLEKIFGIHDIFFFLNNDFRRKIIIKIAVLNQIYTVAFSSTFVHLGKLVKGDKGNLVRREGESKR